MIPNYQVPAVTGLSSSAIATPNSSAAFRVVGIPSNDVLNIREQPTSQSRIVGVIPPNATGVVFAGDRSDDGSWLFVRYGGTSGWVAARYLQEAPLPPIATSPPLAPPPSAPSDEAEREKRDEAAKRERERLQRQAAQEQLKSKLEELGFKLLEPVDLDLDWKNFMANNTKVAVRGTYVEANDVEVLSTPDNKDQPTIRLYTDDASRAARKIMLECRNSSFALAKCDIIVGAMIRSCIRNKGELNEKEVPCLKVQEAYLIP